jgi:hypothetical protein
MGISLAAAMLTTWDGVRPRPRAVGADDLAALRRMIDDNESPRGLYLFDEDVGYRFKPNFRGVRHSSASHSHVTNSLAILGKREIDRSPAVNRVLILGDSVTYGDGVPFHAVFTSVIQRQAPERYQLMNAACPGWNTRQEREFFRSRLAEIEWQAKVLVFCLNDLAEYQWARFPDGHYEILMQESLDGTLQKSLAQLNLAGVRRRLGSPLDQHDDAMLLAWNESRWDAYGRSQLLPLLDAGPPLIVVAVPTLYQIEAAADGTPTELAFYPQRRLAAFCGCHDVPFVDVSEAFTQPGAPEAVDCFLPNDYVHFNEVGHAVVGAYLWPKLKQSLDALAHDASR